jgi:hypothetical protein
MGVILADGWRFTDPPKRWMTAMPPPRGLDAERLEHPEARPQYDLRLSVNGPGRETRRHRSVSSFGLSLP